jgi:pimeloyl-ACP methyl ester carboxylesterase
LFGERGFSYIHQQVTEEKMRGVHRFHRLFRALLFGCCLSFIVLADSAEEAATWSFGVGNKAAVPHTVTVSGNTIVADISALPEKAEVFRAVLRCRREGRRRDGVVVASVDRPDEPLPLMPPRFASLDATEPVRRAMARGAGKVEFQVKAFSGRERETTRLDVSLLGGKAKNDLPAPKGFRARHRNGQTFLTWQECDPPTTQENLTVHELRDLRRKLDEHREVRYRIYRSKTPITAATIAEAELVDEVSSLTCWNGDFYGASPKPEDAALRYVVEDGKKPVPSGMGIYAHNPAKAGKAYYAVTLTVNGEENLTTFSRGNALISPLHETVGPGDPILQRIEKPKTFLYFDNPTLHYYVRWESPPRSNLPSRPFDYLVGIPPNLARPVPLGLHLHCWGGSLNGGYIWWYKAREGAILFASNQIPYDWWVAYHEARETWKAWDEGVTRDYTVKRLLSFVDWIGTKWEVDKTRVFVTGASMGGSGASMIALRYPERFAYALSSVGVHNGGRSPQFTGSYEGVCGPAKSRLLHESGMATFDYLNNTYLLRQDPKRDVPFISFTNGKNDGGIGWPQAAEFARTLQETRQPHLFTWGQSGHGHRVYVPTPTAAITQRQFWMCASARAFPPSHSARSMTILGMAIPLTVIPKASSTYIFAGKRIRWWKNGIATRSRCA